VLCALCRPSAWYTLTLTLNPAPWTATQVVALIEDDAGFPYVCNDPSTGADRVVHLLGYITTCMDGDLNKFFDSRSVVPLRQPACSAFVRLSYCVQISEASLPALPYYLLAGCGLSPFCLRMSS
jgi:hypothetical protein